MHIDELDGNPDLVAGFADTAFQDGAHHQRLPDFRNILLGTLVFHDGGAGDHV
jgi:hypothetical protein